jgi:hypothetical protein
MEHWNPTGWSLLFGGFLFGMIAGWMHAGETLSLVPYATILAGLTILVTNMHSLAIYPRSECDPRPIAELAARQSRESTIALGFTRRGDDRPSEIHQYAMIQISNQHLPLPAAVVYAARPVEVLSSMGVMDTRPFATVNGCAPAYRPNPTT